MTPHDRETKVFPTIATNRVNNQIIAAELRVIDEEGKNLGVLERSKALALAEEKGLDLVLIDANLSPPVARFANYDKFRYQKEKEVKRERRLTQQKSSDLKQVRITARAAKHDLDTRAKKVEELFEEGHQVEIVMRLRGREKANKPWAFQKMQDFLQMLPIEYKVLNAPKWSGFGITALITKK